MKSYSIDSAELTVKRIHLDIEKLAMQCGFHSSCISNVSLRESLESVGQEMVLQLQAKIASKKFDSKTVKFPAGPWQWIKFNLHETWLYQYRFTRWFLKRYPVKMVEITMEANAYYPDIVIPDHDAFVDVIIRNREANL